MKKTILEHLNELPEPERSRAVEYLMSGEVNISETLYALLGEDEKSKFARLRKLTLTVFGRTDTTS